MVTRRKKHVHVQPNLQYFRVTSPLVLRADLQFDDRGGPDVMIDVYVFYEVVHVN